MSVSNHSLGVLLGESRDVFVNLAIEELMLLDRNLKSPAVFFCRNARAVVIGRNQNPWLESDPRCLSDNGITLARRISGGGTVYHDPGNLNYGLVMPKNDYDREEILALVVRALASLGIESRIEQKSSIFVDGGKISGSAFCFKRDKVLHHGTILIDADPTQLSRSLRSVPYEIETHAIRSVPARVANLRDIDPEVDADACIAALGASFADHFARPIVHRDAASSFSCGQIERLTRARADAEWVLGNTPAFSVPYDDASGARAKLVFKHARLARIEPMPDEAPDPKLGMKFSDFLEVST